MIFLSTSKADVLQMPSAIEVFQGNFEFLKKNDFWPNYAIFFSFFGSKNCYISDKIFGQSFLPRELIFCITYPRPNTPTRFFQENVFFWHFDLLLPNLLFLLIFVVSGLKTTYFNKIYFFLSIFASSFQWYILRVNQKNRY